MEGAARDSTEDWLLPASSRPPLIGELERRVDLALATARASEAAVMTIGAAALDAAEQARRAAELAERASATTLEVQGALQAQGRPEAQGDVTWVAVAPTPRSQPKDDDLSDFSARADRLVAPLRQLQRVPL